jgi:Zn-dependent M28 family amino/carboxypeptidase
VGTNVLAKVEGSDPALEGRTVVISAHYDHLGHGIEGIFNGANDNAAGVSAIIAVGCALAKSAPRRTVLIAAWDAEEPPTFLQPMMGSRYYVEHPTVPLESTDVAIVLDLVGSGMWPGYPGHFMMGSETSDAVTAALKESPSPVGLSRLVGGLHLAERTPQGGQQAWSDYDAFRNSGVPVLFLSDGQNKRYHTPEDDVSGLDLPKLALEARSLLDLTWTLANASRTPVFKPDGASDLTDAQTVVSVLEAALAPQGLASALSLSAVSRARLESDLTAARAVEARALTGTALTPSELQTLRKATQRVMCHAGPQYSSFLCNAF